MENPKHSFTVKDGVLTQYRGPGGDVALPEGITRIAYAAFRDGGSVTHITVPAGVTEISTGAFQDCEHLTEIILPEGLERVDASAFWGCRSLKRLRLPASVTRFQGGFHHCDALAEVEAPGVSETGKDAFGDCGGALILPRLPLSALGRDQKLNALSGWLLARERGVPYEPEVDAAYWRYIKSQRKRLYPAALRNERLMRLMAEHGLLPEEDSPERAFSITPKGVLKAYHGPGGEVTVPEGVVKIGPRAFARSAVSSVTLPAGVTEIGPSAFANCKSLEEVYLPAGLRKIGEAAFYGCTALTWAELPDGLRTMGESAFARCEALGGIALPEGLAQLPGQAFWGCVNLEEVRLPEGLMVIGVGAFECCGRLREAVLPASLRRVELYAFRGCTALRRVVVLGDRLSGPDSAFAPGAGPLPCILARAGSPAERFAKKCGYPFEAID